VAIGVTGGTVYFDNVTIGSTAVSGVYPARVTVQKGGTLRTAAASTVGAGSTIELVDTGKIVSTSTLTFSGTGTVLNTGTLGVTGGAGTASIANTVITGTPNISAAAVTGNFTLSAGTTTAFAYTYAANTQLNLVGKIKVIAGNTAYDTAELGGTTVAGTAGGITFDASATATGGRIIIENINTTVKGGGTLNTRGKGVLRFTNANTTLTTNAGDQNLSLPDLTGNGIVSGSLALAAQNVLTVGGVAFNVGAVPPTGFTPTGTTAALNVSSGTVKLVTGGSISVGNGTASGLIFGTFTNGSSGFSIAGTSTDATITGVQPDPADAIILGAEQLSGAFSNSSSHVTAGTSAAVAGGTNVNVTITRGGADNTITSASKLYSTN
jgi:hypothetical protein